MAWKWSEDCAPEGLDNEVSEYPVAAEIREDYQPYLEEKLG